MKIKIINRNVEIKKGDCVKGFNADVPGIWEIEKLRPFTVVAYQNGKKWDINVSAREFAGRKLRQEMI